MSSKPLTSPADFRRVLLVDTDAGPQRLADVADDWQLADFEALDPGWRRVAGEHVDGALMRAYLERPRGHSKTADLAVMVAWVLFASTKRLHGVAAAADRDQARLLRDAIARLVALNPWLAEVFDVQAYRVVHKVTGSVLEILSADVPGSWGITPHFVVVDELTHWTEAAAEFWTSLFSSAAKRGGCMLCVISNSGAGKGSCWQWGIREAARESDDWYFSRLDGPKASWISEAILAEQRRLLPAVAYDRLWLNLWTSGSSKAIPDADIMASVTLAGPLNAPQVGWSHWVGVDLGLSRDASAMVVLARRHGSVARFRVVSLKVWQPRPGVRVQVEAIEDAIREAVTKFRVACVALDTWQSEYLNERLRKTNIRTESVHYTPANQQAMAAALVEAFSERRLEIWPDERLLADLRSLRVVERAGTWRLDAARSRDGSHADTAQALALAAFTSRNSSIYGGGVWGGVITLPGTHLAGSREVQSGLMPGRRINV